MTGTSSATVPATPAGATETGPTGRPRRHFSHAPDLWAAHPRLRVVAAVVELAGGADGLQALRPLAAEHLSAASAADRPSESALDPVTAWRATFAATGVRPTQYRCAAESLLRRLRTRGDLPVLHPLVDLGNALSVRWAVPVAVLDLDRVTGDLVVRRCAGDEVHDAFDGTSEHPDRGEVAYVDDAGHAHSRRWCWRQSSRSVVTPATTRALVVTEALHESADADLGALGGALQGALAAVGATAVPTVLTPESPRLLLPAAPSATGGTARDRLR